MSRDTIKYMQWTCANVKSVQTPCAKIHKKHYRWSLPKSQQQSTEDVIKTLESTIGTVRTQGTKDDHHIVIVDVNWCHRNSQRHWKSRTVKRRSTQCNRRAGTGETESRPPKAVENRDREETINSLSWTCWIWWTKTRSSTVLEINHQGKTERTWKTRSTLCRSTLCRGKTAGSQGKILTLIS